jgi:mono/diheme cytochrome c family protein
MGARSIRRFALLVVVATSAVSVVSLPSAFGHAGTHTARNVYCPACSKSSTPIVGNAVVGGKLFTTQACAACHVLAYAHATGKLGPNLDTLQPAYATVVTQVTVGGKALMGAAARQYKTVMKGYKGILSTAQIQDIAKYVVDYAGKAVVTGGNGTTTTTAGSGGGGIKGDGCPPGQTIVSLAADDHDDDDTGGPTDGDGCV